jgi:hypothetical protein
VTKKVVGMACVFRAASAMEMNLSIKVQPGFLYWTSSKINKEVEKDNYLGYLEALEKLINPEERSTYQNYR